MSSELSGKWRSELSKINTHKSELSSGPQRALGDIPRHELDDCNPEAKQSKLEACVSCGGMIPERQAPPYEGHLDDCELVKQWKKND